MTGVRFDLKPYQWPPSAQGQRLGFADAVFAVEWDGAEVEVAARWVKVRWSRALLYFRPIGEDSLHVVAASHSGRVSLYFLPDMFKKDARRNAFVEKTVRKAIKGWGLTFGYAARVPLSVTQGATPQWIFLLHDASQGAWQGELPGCSTPFAIKDRSEISLDAMQNAETSLGFASQWSQLSREEQMRRAICFCNGTLEELERLVAAVALLDPALKEQSCQAFFYVDATFILGRRTFAQFERAAPNARRRRWAFYFGRYFAPHLDPFLKERHLCIKHSYISTLVSLSLSPPTQHERLEAALTLRDWAKDKIPEREARLLLPKL